MAFSNNSPRLVVSRPATEATLLHPPALLPVSLSFHKCLPPVADCPSTFSNSRGCRCKCLPFGSFGTRSVGGGLSIHLQQLPKLSLPVFAVRSVRNSARRWRTAHSPSATPKVVVASVRRLLRHSVRSGAISLTGPSITPPVRGDQT